MSPLGQPVQRSCRRRMGNSATVEVSSGQVKLNRQFVVPEGGATTMLIDFDGAASVHELGNGRFRMTPVIAVTAVQQPRDPGCGTLPSDGIGLAH